jgi:hypothetical protein
MAQCNGNLTLSTNVDAEMREYIEREAEKRAITPTEYLRRLLDLYKASSNGEVYCPECGVSADLTEAV